MKIDWNHNLSIVKEMFLFLKVSPVRKADQNGITVPLPLITSDKVFQIFYLDLAPSFLLNFEEDIHPPPLDT